MTDGQDEQTPQIFSKQVREGLQTAKSLDKAGKWPEAVAIFEDLLARAPDNVAALVAYGRALAARRLPAETQLRRAMELNPANEEIKVGYGTWLLEMSRLDEAEAILAPLLERDQPGLRVIEALADIAERRNQMERAFELYHRAVRLMPEEPAAYTSFVKFLRRVEGDHAERAAELGPESAKTELFLARSMRRVGKSEDAKAALRRAAELEPDSKAGRTATTALSGPKTPAHSDGRAPARTSVRPAIWPVKTHLFEDFESVVRRYVLAGVPKDVDLISRTTKVANMGSCFAEHLADRLIMRGLDVFHRRVAENINSTYANRYLLDWVVEGVHDDRSAQMESYFGAAEREAYRTHLSDAEVFIFSLGAAPCLFEADTGAFVLPYERSMSRHLETVFRTTTVEENVDNLNRIVSRLRTLSPKVKVVLTVSPVALEGTQEMRSAVQADCISKSTLRLATHEFLSQGLDGAYYWPSFEIARWLSGHLPQGHEPAFGWGGSTRHVALWLQDLIISLFLEYFGDETVALPTRALQPA